MKQASIGRNYRVYSSGSRAGLIGSSPRGRRRRPKTPRASTPRRRRAGAAWPAGVPRRRARVVTLRSMSPSAVAAAPCAARRRARPVALARAPGDHGGQSGLALGRHVLPEHRVKQDGHRAALAARPRAAVQSTASAASTARLAPRAAVDGGVQARQPFEAGRPRRRPAAGGGRRGRPGPPACGRRRRVRSTLTGASTGGGGRATPSGCRPARPPAPSGRVSQFVGVAVPELVETGAGPDLELPDRQAASRGDATGSRAAGTLSGAPRWSGVRDP